MEKRILRVRIGDMGGDGHERTQDFLFRSNKMAADIRAAHAFFVQKYGVGCHDVVGSPNKTIIFCQRYEERKYNANGLNILYSIGFPDIPEHLDKWGMSVADYPIEIMYLEMAKFMMPNFTYETVERDEIETVNTQAIGYGAIG